jgi:polysaccharide transporter, PST family
VIISDTNPLKRTWPQNRLSDLVNHALVQNALSLSGVQIASYVVPLVTIPYLARVLGAAEWGLIAFTQSFGSFVTLVVEYGFSLSATREVSRYRNDREKLSSILAGVLGAKGLIAGASVAIAILVRSWIPIFREHPILLWAGMFWALSQAFSMMWFFQGLERMRIVATLDIAAKALATIAIFILVRNPDDSWLVLITQGCGFLLSFTIGLGLAYHKLPFRLPRWGSSCDALRMGWVMFLSRGSASLYAVGNAFILGLFVSPQLVGYYAGAEKISRAFLGLFAPISQTLYPRQSHLVLHDRVRAVQLARIGVIIMGAGGSTIGAAVCAFSPLIVRIILGNGFLPAVPVLQVLSLLVPVMAVTTALGVLWMLPLGLDRIFTPIILSAGLINTVLASVLALLYGAIGMAWAVVSAEIFILCSFSLVLYRLKLHPMSRLASSKVDMAQAGL